MSTIKVKFSIPGVAAIGNYLPDKVYDVEPAEARRLINVKGFTADTPEELKKLEDLEAKVPKAAAAAVAKAPAEAT
jgi:hypothetical protein